MSGLKLVVDNTKRPVIERNEEIVEIADAIYNGFIWDLTPQGSGYWEQVYINLMGLSNEYDK
tara:strand:+ start:5308 stop:5493 length:186 start_codon:yes stop_codon:yes gene_type:complete